MIHTAVEIKNVFWPKSLKAARRGDQVVHEDDALARKCEPRGEGIRIENPRNVRSV